MITHMPPKQDIFLTKVEVITNPVNCVGVMGKGLALQFKRKFPQNNAAYVKACKDQTLQPGRVFFFQEDNTWIANFPTKRHWSMPSQYPDIENGLDDLIMQMNEKNLQSIAIPPLGCGLGGLSYRDQIYPLLKDKLTDVSFTAHVPQP